MKRLYLITCLFLFSITIFSQNQTWTLPGSFLDMVNPNFPTLKTLPAPEISGNPGLEHPNYAGQQSNFAHNAIHKATGELWFFIVDGIVYDGDGFYIGVLNEDGYEDSPAEGYSDICVVPDPGNCNRFYIFSTDGDVGFQIPTYSYLNMSKENIDNEAPYGVLYSFYQDDGFNGGLSDFLTAIHLNSLGLDLPLLDHSNNISYAATDLLANNKRYVYMKHGSFIYMLTIDEDGIHYQGDVVNLETITGLFFDDNNVARAELELHKLDNGHFRLGYSSTLLGMSLDPIAVIGTIDMNEDGVFILNSEKFFAYPSNNNSSTIVIRGLEFSNSGEILYFTHNKYAVDEDSFEYFDVNSETVNPVVTTPGSNVANYKYSHIEKDENGTMYLPNASGMATLQNTDSPESLIWTQQAISFGGYTYNLSSGSTNNPKSTAYTLPDQIDGMDYVAYILDDYTCCIEQFEFDVTTYTANANDVWKPNDNPLNNSSGSIVTIENELRISAGRSIRIDDMELRFKKGARLIIEPTGYLRLRNTTLTALDACGVQDFWEGVQVQGTTSSTQTTAVQGKIFMQSGSTIENALVGISTEVDGQSQSGGIISASSSFFINNVQDVVFMQHPGNNISYFSGCTFKTTSGYLGDYNSQVPVHVTLNEVESVSFTNADFLEQRTGLNINTQGATGIAGNLSSFEVKSGSEFTGLKYGIRTFGSLGSTYPVIVDNSNFNNRFNIYLEDVIGAEILENEITVIPADQSDGVYPYGLYLEHCFDYRVEQNHFHSSSQPKAVERSLGIVVRNSHEGNEELYFNKFDQFAVGIEPLDQNRVNQSGKVYQGLQIRCNIFNDCIWDIAVLPSVPGNVPPPVLYGIAAYQGLVPPPVYTYDLGGNTFTDINYNGLELNYLNFEGSGFPDMSNVTYWYHNNENQYPRLVPNKRTAEPKFQIHTVGTLSYDPELSCPSKINGGGGSSKSLLLAEKNEEQVQVQNSLNELENTVDGGSTTQMEGTVATTTDQNAWSAYQRLMNEQGYLSDEVLKGVSEKEDGLSKAMVRNVLVANPASAKSADVQEKLDNRLDPLPDYMRYQIDQGLNQISPREAMENLVSGHQYQRDMAIREAAHIILTDTLLSEGDKKNELVTFYSGTNDKINDLKSALLFDRFGETQLAENVFEQLLLEYQGTAFASEIEEYLELRATVSGWNSTSGLNDGQLSTLSNYENGKAMAASYARGLLLLNGNEIAREHTIIPEEGNKSGDSGKKRKWDLAISDHMMLVYPNPAEDFITLRYAITETYNQLLVVVYDTKGNSVWSRKLNYDRDEVIIPLNNLPAGNYYVQLLRDGQTFKTKKVSLVR